MKLKHIIKIEKGQAMVEFALVLPILLLLDQLVVVNRIIKKVN